MALSESSTKDEFIAAIRAEVERAKKPDDGHDNEMEHCRADDMLLLALKAAGWGELADAWHAWNAEVGFWYA